MPSLEMPILGVDDVISNERLDMGRRGRKGRGGRSASSGVRKSEARWRESVSDGVDETAEWGKRGRRPGREAARIVSAGSGAEERRGRMPAVTRWVSVRVESLMAVNVAAALALLVRCQYVAICALMMRRCGWA